MKQKDQSKMAAPSSQLYQKANAAARAAVDFDTRGDRRQAALLYEQCASLLAKACHVDPDAARAQSMGRRALQYEDRAMQLRPPAERVATARPGTNTTGVGASDYSKQYRMGLHSLREARELHEGMRFTEARKTYEQAAQQLINASGCAPDEAIEEIRGRATEALAGAESIIVALFPQRAERIAAAQKANSPGSLKKALAPDSIPEAQHSTSGKSVRSQLPAAPSVGAFRDDGVSSKVNIAIAEHGSRLADDELAVLTSTSRVNSKLYLPWVAGDYRERFGGIGEFSDSDGLLHLAPGQKAQFQGWSRPSELFRECKMVFLMGSRAITQTVVSDCSFVSSLAISADYERRFKNPIITNNLFPQNSKGEPIISPSGKYMVRLHVNGVWRKVVIDDKLPVGKGGGRSLLCSYSNNPGELWISLLEKAYMKVMGGYDFPGSNSAVDMHTLTGWIPERLPVRECTDGAWKALWRNMHQGLVLVTLGTGGMTETEESRCGLASRHAYALLDIREIDSKRLLKLKNPWNRMRWKGRYSPDDAKSWTPELRQKLGYDVETARQVDNGEFWIDWAAVQKFYDVIYMSWNPRMFKHRYTVHRCWRPDGGPLKDSYNLERNPQFRVEVLDDLDSAVWVLLSRHITDIKDFGDNKEYITVHVFEGGNRVLYPEGFLFQGVKINSPHYLAKLKGGKGSVFTLVLSQWELNSVINYTLQVLSSKSVCRVTELPNPYLKSARITSAVSFAFLAGTALGDQTSSLWQPIHPLGPRC